MKKKIFITRNIPDAGLALLRRRRNLSIDIFEKDRAISPRELRYRAYGAEILLPLLTDKIDGATMDAIGPQLRIIANYAVGYDNIDLVEAKKRGIIVANAACPELSETVAEHVIALIFALSHRIAEADQFARNGKYKGWGPMMLLGNDVSGKTIGIVGAGAIGTSVARRLRDGFGVKVLYFDVQANPRIEQEAGATRQTLKQLLQRSDIVSVHVPLLPTTHHLIGAKEFTLMKAGAYLINTSRGPVVDESALITALQQSQIAGAGIDVYEHEPSIPRALRRLKNTILTPHTASATWGARNAMSRQAAINILAYLDGTQPPNALNA